MLKQISFADYHLIQKLATSRHLALVIDAMIAHPIPAAVWVDDPASPRLAFAWDNAYNYYFLGDDALAAELGELLASTVLSHARANPRWVGKFFFTSAAWEAALPALLPVVDVRRLERRFYAFPPSSLAPAIALPEGYRLQLIDADLLASDLQHLGSLRGELWSMWRHPEDFLRFSFGCVIVQEREHALACWCTAEYLSKGTCGLGIETMEAYQRHGLATAAASAVVREALSRGLMPHWDCWETNTPSTRVAEKVGFILCERYAILLGRFPEENAHG